MLGIIGASTASYFPVMLRAAGCDALSMTACTGGDAVASLRIALRWFRVASPLALLYLGVVFRLHCGTAVAAADLEGY